MQEAAAALDALATGRVPARAALLSGALSLDTLCNCIVPDRDLMDAAAGLETLVTGRTLDLDAAGRQRAAKLAERVRQVAAMLALAPAPAVQ